MSEELVEAVARIIAQNLDDDFDAAFSNKAEWVDARGGEPFRDINMPFKGDYLDAARAALAVARPAILEEAAKVADERAKRADSAISFGQFVEFHCEAKQVAESIAAAIRSLSTKSIDVGGEG